jgi:hypothetical protein
LGSGREDRKVIVQITDENGFTRAYAKIGTTQNCDAAIARESSALQRLARLEFSHLLHPQLLEQGKWGERSFCIISGPPGPITRTTARLGSIHLRAIEDLARHSLGFSSPEELARQAAVECRDRGGAGAAPAPWLAAIERCLSHAEVKGIPVHWAHGDCAPWNMGEIRDTLFLYDWEMNDTEAPAGWDCAHFAFQVANLTWRYGIRRAALAVLKDRQLLIAIGEHLGRLGSEKRMAETIVRLYLLKRAAAEARSAANNFGASARANVLLDVVEAHLDGRA